MSEQQESVWGYLPQANRQTLEALIKKHAVKTVLEIGSFMGLSAIWFAQRVDHVTCVDRWWMDHEPDDREIDRHYPSQQFWEAFHSNLTAAGVVDKVLAIRGDSNIVNVLAPEADLVYIDADHSYEGCWSDIFLYGPKARKVLCGDDFGNPGLPGVRKAVEQVFPGVKVAEPFWWVEKA